MSGEEGARCGPTFGTARLFLRPMRAGDSKALHVLWAERDPRVPAHRQIDADGRPTVADLEESIRANPPTTVGLLAVELLETEEVIGYCGLVDSGRPVPGEPELASNCSDATGAGGMPPKGRWPSWTGPDRPGTSACGQPYGTGIARLAGCSPNSASWKLANATWTPRTAPPCSPRENSHATRPGPRCRGPPPEKVIASPVSATISRRLPNPSWQGTARSR